MNRTEFKKIIKEAILELVDEGKISVSSPSSKLSVQQSSSSIKEKSNHLSEMIKANAQNVSATKGKNSQEAALLGLLADTASTTFVRQKETEEFGYTSEEKDRFDAMFPDALKEHFNKLFK